LISCVRPGVLEARASALRPVSALIRVDFPTLERPGKADLGPVGGGHAVHGDDALEEIRAAREEEATLFLGLSVGRLGQWEGEGGHASLAVSPTDTRPPLRTIA
jgi:hypothetical protein